MRRGRRALIESYGKELERNLAEVISLSRMADVLGVSRFQLMQRFERLGVPVRIGPASPDEARDEVRVAGGIERR